MSTVSVGIREFRENLTSYLEADGPIEITRHGEAVGLYVPRKKQWTEADRAAFLQSHEAVQRELQSKGVRKEDLMREAQRIRKAKRR